MLKIGLALEGLLVDMQMHFDQWKIRQGEASSYLDTKVVNNESFWASLKPHYDSEISVEGEVFILTERPKKLLLITRSWLRRELGLNIPDENILMHSFDTLKRYDCRIYDLDYYIDTDPMVLAGFRYDRCIPIGISRDGREFESWIRTFDSLTSVEFGEDLRDWKTFNDEEM